MGQMNDKSLDHHFAKQLRMMSHVYSSNMSKSDFLISQCWVHVFNMARTTQDKYARNCLMLLMYGQLREIAKLSMPFIRKTNARRPLIDVLSEYQGIQEAESDTEPETVVEPPEGLLGEAEERHRKLGPGQAQLKKKMKEKRDEEEGQSRTEPKSEAQTTQNVAQMMCSFSNTMHPLQARYSNFNTVSQQDQALLWDDINHTNAYAVENQQHYKQADCSWKRPLLQVNPPLPTVSQKDHTCALDSQEEPHSTHLLLPQIKYNAHLAMHCLKNWNPASGPLNFFNITLQHILDDEPETRKKLFELDRNLEALLSNILEQASERHEKNIRLLYDHLYKQQQESLDCKREQIRQEQRSLNLARKHLQEHVQDLKRHENIFQQQQPNYHHHHHHSQEQTSSYKYCETSLDELPRSAMTQTDRSSIVASTVNLCCGNDCRGVNSNAWTNNDTSVSDSCSSVYNCSECQTKCKPLPSRSSKRSLVRS